MEHIIAFLKSMKFIFYRILLLQNSKIICYICRNVYNTHCDINANYIRISIEKHKNRLKKYHFCRKFILINDEFTPDFIYLIFNIM